MDPQAKTRAPLALPALRDPDLPAARPALTVCDPVVSPDGRHLAFAGFRDPGEGLEGRGYFIYICSLEGSDLRRVTPVTDAPVGFYSFPGTGKTGLDVSREIAKATEELPGPEGK